MPINNNGSNFGKPSSRPAGTGMAGVRPAQSQASPSQVGAGLAQAAPAAKWIEYTIQRGDNLTVIARKFNVTVNDLVKWNNIPNPDLIYAGATLKIQQ